MTKWVVDVNNFTGNAKTYLNKNGVCPYYGKTEEEYIAEGYSILNDEEFFKMVKDWEDGLIGKWKEISLEEFDDMLDILPPVAWYNGGFFMSERYTGNISSFYQKINGKCYTSLQRMNTPRNKIIAELLEFIKANK